MGRPHPGATGVRGVGAAGAVHALQRRPLRAPTGEATRRRDDRSNDDTAQSRQVTRVCPDIAADSGLHGDAAAHGRGRVDLRQHGGSASAPRSFPDLDDVVPEADHRIAYRSRRPGGRRDHRRHVVDQREDRQPVRGAQHSSRPGRQHEMAADPVRVLEEQGTPPPAPQPARSRCSRYHGADPVPAGPAHGTGPRIGARGRGGSSARGPRHVVPAIGRPARPRPGRSAYQGHRGYLVVSRTVRHRGGGVRSGRVHPRLAGRDGAEPRRHPGFHERVRLSPNAATQAPESRPTSEAT